MPAAHCNQSTTAPAHQTQEGGHSSRAMQVYRSTRMSGDRAINHRPPQIICEMDGYIYATAECCSHTVCVRFFDFAT